MREERIEEKEYLKPRKRIELEKVINSGYKNMAGMVVLKNGRTLYEGYFNQYAPENTVHIASVTKSVLSSLFGIAMEKGSIQSVNEKVLDFFPEYTVPHGERTIQGITIRDMLTMTAPYKYKKEPYEKFFLSENWLKTALDLLGGKGNGGDFLYSAMVGTHILSGILVKATGQSVLDFARENLFLPLGIRVEQSVELHNKEEHISFFNKRDASGWVVDHQGIHTAGFGLTLTPKDMARYGQLYLDRGIYMGQRIVPEWWIEESTRASSRYNSKLLYGYLWWILDEKKHIYAALGDGGNVIYINADRNLVISIASFFIPGAKDRIKLIKEYLEPLFD